jgi:hypothetical protein
MEQTDIAILKSTFTLRGHFNKGMQGGIGRGGRSSHPADRLETR